MKFARILRASAAAAALTAVGIVAGCAEGEIEAGSSPQPIRIGAVYNVTGPDAPFDTPALDGVRLAVDRINAGGGLLGSRVELLERDAQSDPATARRATHSLVDAGVAAIVGLSDAGQVLAAAPVAAQAGIPFITSGAGTPTLPDQVPDWLFLACYGDNAQAAAGAQYALKRLRARHAAVVYDSSREPETLLARYFTESYAAQGGAVVTSIGLDGSAGELDGFAGGEALGSDPDGGKRRGSAPALVYLAVAADDAGALVRRLRGSGYTGVIMGGAGFEDRLVRQAAAATGGDVVFTSHAPLGLAAEASAAGRFTHWYEAAYGRAPENTHACLGFDAIELVAAAIVTARSAEPSAVRAALLATQDFAGVTGTLSYAGGTRVPRKEVTVIEVGRRERVAATFVPGDVPQPWLQP